MPISAAPRAAPDEARLVAENRQLRGEVARLRELRGEAAIYRQNIAVNTFLRLARDCYERSGELRADAYVAHGPEALPAAEIVAGEVGGQVYCDVVEMPSFGQRSANYDYHPTNLSLLNHAFDGYLRDAAGLTTIGWALKEELRRYGRPVTVIPNYRYAEEFVRSDAIREQCGLGPEDRLLLASSTICSGFAPIVEALKLLPDSVHLATLGSIVRGYRDEVHALPERLGVEKRVHFFDPVPYEQLVTAASGADLALMALDPELLNDRISLPNRLFDCIAAGLPIVTPDVPDVAHIVEERGIGLTVAHNQASFWAAAIQAGLDNLETLRAKVAAAAQQLVWESIGDKLHAAYDNAESITFIAYSDLVGHQRTARMVDTLVKRGVRVTVCCPHEAPAPEGAFSGSRLILLRRPTAAPPAPDDGGKPPDKMAAPAAAPEDAVPPAAVPENTLQPTAARVVAGDAAAAAAPAVDLSPSQLHKIIRIEETALDKLKQELISLRYRARRYDEVKDDLARWRSKAARYDQLKKVSGAGLLAPLWRGLRLYFAGRGGRGPARSPLS